MSIHEKSGFCLKCNKNVLVRRNGTNHILHFLITFFTLGFWVIGWIFSSIITNTSAWHCSQCGSRLTDRAR